MFGNLAKVSENATISYTFLILNKGARGLHQPRDINLFSFCILAFLYIDLLGFGRSPKR